MTLLSPNISRFSRSFGSKYAIVTIFGVEKQQEERLSVRRSPNA